MILSCKDTFTPGTKRTRVEARITKDHPASNYGQPVLALEGGGALDLLSWFAMDYRVEKATARERSALRNLGLV